MASTVHGHGRHAHHTTTATHKHKLTAEEKAAKKIASYIHGHRRHGSPLAAGATHDAWGHKGMRTK